MKNKRSLTDLLPHNEFKAFVIFCCLPNIFMEFLNESNVQSTLLKPFTYFMTYIELIAHECDV